MQQGRRVVCKPGDMEEGPVGTAPSSAADR
jgi:hypothetical protein